MPVYQLIDDVSLFPPHELAEPGGLLAYGGDLSITRLLSAYQQGIFPWYEDGSPILWWSPDPRLILEPGRLKISRSLRKTLRKKNFEIRSDTSFEEVINACATVRLKNGEGTWITKEMEHAYNQLHELGYAHSVEVWENDQLVGGLYGVYIGRCFFGESMFMKTKDASKVALVALVAQAREWEIHFIDCQVTTNHLISLGAQEVSRREFLRRLRLGMRYNNPLDNWKFAPHIYLRCLDAPASS